MDTSAMTKMLISPRRAAGWRVDVEALASWLRGRWPEIELSRGTSDHRDHLWCWPDGYEVWIPSDRQCAWVDADWHRVSAIAAWLSGTSVELILCDEGFENHLDLRGVSEEHLLTLDWLAP